MAFQTSFVMIISSSSLDVNHATWEALIMVMAPGLLYPHPSQYTNLMQLFVCAGVHNG